MAAIASAITALLLLLSAFSLVASRNEARQLFIALDRAQTQAQSLEVDWRRLQLQRAELERNARVDDLARNQLKMMPIAPDRTLYIYPSAQADGGTSTPTGAEGK